MSKASDTVEATPSLETVGQECARLYRRVRNGAPTDFKIPTSLIIYKGSVDSFQRQITESGKKVAELIACPGFVDYERDLISQRGAEKMSRLTGALGQASSRLAEAREEFAESKRKAIGDYDTAMKENQLFYEENQEAIFELAVIEAHLDGHAPSLDYPVVIG